MPAPVSAAQVKHEVALEDLFADVHAGKSASDETRAAFEDLENPRVMLTFYRRLFPFKPVYHWLNQDHKPTRAFTHREFAFTLANDVYLRYNSYDTWEAFRDHVLRLNPKRFEIGPVYSGRPTMRKTLLKASFKPVLRELVFDIDMTDYDEIRTCCSGGSVCRRCWQFIAMAVRVIDASLRDDFGFTHLLWVYSGRRGIHCWVSDPEALALNDEQRRAVVTFLELVKGGAKMDKKVKVSRPLHPRIQAALDMLKRDFFDSSILQDQEAFRSPEQAETLLKLISSPAVVHQMRERWDKKGTTSSKQRWLDLKNVSFGGKDQQRKQDAHTHDLDDIVLQYTYPRVDVEVSKHMNHLLKSPFVVHPSTGRVCVPVLPDQVDTFDPTAVPRVADLLMELEAAARAGEANATWEHTSLKRYVDILDRHVAGILRDRLADKKAANEDSMEF